MNLNFKIFVAFFLVTNNIFLKRHLLNLSEVIEIAAKTKGSHYDKSYVRDTENSLGFSN